jgi:hypothetical protein
MIGHGDADLHSGPRVGFVTPPDLDRRGRLLRAALVAGVSRGYGLKVLSTACRP